VTDDNLCTAADVLAVINYINSHPLGAGEGEPTRMARSEAFVRTWQSHGIVAGRPMTRSDHATTRWVARDARDAMNPARGQLYKVAPRQEVLSDQRAARSTRRLGAPTGSTDISGLDADLPDGDLEETLQLLASDVVRTRKTPFWDLMGQ